MKKIFLLILLMVTFPLSGFSKMNSLRSYDSVGAFLQEHPLAGRQLEVEVTGSPLLSRYGKLNCVYWESAILGDSHENRMEKNESAGNLLFSQEPFTLIINQLYHVQIKPGSTLRLFISPSHEQKFNARHASSTEDPKKLRQKNEVHAKKVDYCLQEKKKYYLWIKQESRSYGPPDPATGRRMQHEYYFLNLSDQPFKDGQPQVEPTPTFKDWIYS